MDRILPWLAVGAGILSVALVWRKEGARWGASHAVACLVALAAVYAAGFLFKSELRGVVEVAHGIAIGAAATLISSFVGGGKPEPMLAAVGLATLAAGVCLLIPDEIRQSAWLGLSIGAGLAAGILSAVGSASGRITAFAVATLAVAALLGSYREGVARAEAMPIAVAVVASMALGGLRFGSYSKWIKWLVLAAALIAAAKLLAVRYLFLGASFNVAVGAVVAAAAVAWILDGDKRASVGSFVIAAMIWLGWSTVAFGLLSGLGLALTVVYGLAFLAGAGSTRGMLSLGVPVALLFYRVFLEMYPAESRQVEIGQHYAVMGIVAGAAIPLALAAWFSQASNRLTQAARPAFALVVGFLVVGVIVAADFVLGSRGTIGMLVGLSIAPFVAGMAPGDRLGVLAVITGLSAIVVGTFRFVSPHLLMDRDSKMQLVGWGVAIAIVLALAAHFLTREGTDEVAA